jgi:hypothetical protein
MLQNRGTNGETQTNIACITDVTPQTSALEDILLSGDCPLAVEFLVLCGDFVKPEVPTL